MYGRELGILKEREEGKQNDQNAPFAGVPRVDRVGHTWTEDLCPRVAHVVLTWPPSKGLLAILASRAPYAFFDRFRPSELRFRIRLRITNRDSHTHDDD